MDLCWEQKNSDTIYGKVKNVVTGINLRLQKPTLSFSVGYWRSESAAHVQKCKVLPLQKSYKLPNDISRLNHIPGKAQCVVSENEDKQQAQQGPAPGAQWRCLIWELADWINPGFSQRQHLHHYTCKCSYEYFAQIQKHHASFTMGFQGSYFKFAKQLKQHPNLNIFEMWSGNRRQLWCWIPTLDTQHGVNIVIFLSIR